MKGLIRKELYISWKLRRTVGLILLGMLVLEILVGFSGVYGNIGKYVEPDMRELYDVLFTVYAFPIVCGYFFLSDYGCTESDFKSKWRMYECTLPISESKVALWKYCRILLGGIASFAVGTGNAAVYALVVTGSVLGNEDLNIYIVMCFIGWITMVIMVLECIKIPLAIFFKSEFISNLVAVGSVNLLLYAVGIALVFKIRELSNLEEMKFMEVFGEYAVKSVIFAMMGTAVFLIAGFLASVKILKRRSV